MDFNEIDRAEYINYKKETDRLNFIKNIHFTDEISLENIINLYFEQIIAMYDIYIQLFYNAASILFFPSIDASIINKMDIKFSIRCVSIEDAIIKESHLKIYNYILIYNKILYINILRENNIINIIIKYQDT